MAPVLTVNWAVSPRIITVEPPDTTLTMQQLVNAGRDLEELLSSLDDPPLFDKVAGKFSLTASLQSTINVRLNNARIKFPPNTTPPETGTATAGDSTGTILEDSSALFITNLVKAGDCVINWVDRSIATVVSVDLETRLTLDGLASGTNNDWTIGDAYTVYSVRKCFLTEGNLSAVDDVGADLDPVLPTAFTQVTRELDTSGALVDSTTILTQLATLLEYEGGRWKIPTADADPDKNKLVKYKENGDVLKKFRLLDRNGAPTSTEPFERVPE